MGKHITDSKLLMLVAKLSLCKTTILFSLNSLYDFAHYNKANGMLLGF